MKAIFKNDRILAAMATVLFFLFLTASAWLYQRNRNLRSVLNGERLKSESLLSEKLALDKEISQWKLNMESLRGKNQETDLKLNEAGKVLKTKEQEIYRLSKDNKNVKELRKQLTETRNLMKLFEQQVSDLNGNLASLRAENNELSLSLQSLRNENENLLARLDWFIARSGDNYLIESQKRREGRITSYARLTKKLVVSFDLPQNVATDLSFTVTTPDGKVLSDNARDFSWKEVESENLMIASTGRGDGEFEVTRRIQMTYHPKQKLGKGIYKINIFNKGENMGCCQVKLK